jgi:hypothetical protein
MRILPAFAVLVGAYGAWPYVSLYQIDQDVRRHDIRALTADFDWSQLREGMKEDIADGITGVPGQAEAVSASAAGSDDDLPPFGSGFVNNMAGNMVDQNVTPRHLAETISTLEAAGASHVNVSRAFFTSPTSFVVALSMGSGGDHPPALRLRMNLVRDGLGMEWKVTRAWVPPQMLAASEAHTS